MIKRKELQKKSLAAVMAASMTMSLLPGTVLADATSGVMKDGVYESTAHVTRMEEEDSEDEWTEYDGDDTAHQYDDLTPEELEEKMEELRKKLFGSKKGKK